MVKEFISQLSPDKLTPFEKHPYQVREDTAMDELVDDGADHLKMPQLLCTDCGSPRATSAKKPCAAGVTGRKRERKRECAKCRLAPFL